MDVVNKSFSFLDVCLHAIPNKNTSLLGLCKHDL